MVQWLGDLAPSTADRNFGIFVNWFEWVRDQGGEFSDLNPDELVEWQIEHSVDARARFRIGDELVKPYIRSVKGRVGYKRKLYSTIRSFFAHNRAELPRDIHFRIRGDKPPVKGSLDVEEVRSMLDSSNQLYRAIILLIVQGGLDLEGLIHVSDNGWGRLRQALRVGEYPIRLDLPGRKGNRNVTPFYTFIGEDTIEALKAYLPIREETVERTGRDPSTVFVNQYGRPLKKSNVQKYWLGHSKRIGIVKPKEGGSRGNRYGKNVHEMRDFFRTRCTKSGVDRWVPEFFLGHVDQIDPNEYEKAFEDVEFMRAQYLHALPWLNIVSGDPGKVSRFKLSEVEADIRREMEERIRVLEEDLGKHRRMLELVLRKLEEKK